MLHPTERQMQNYQKFRIPKDFKTNRAFCGMVNFLSSYLPNLRHLLIPIYDLQKKSKKFKWTKEAEKAFKEIKELLISPPVLRAVTLHVKVLEVLCFKRKETNGLLLVIIQKDCLLQQRILELLN